MGDFWHIELDTRMVQSSTRCSVGPAITLHTKPFSHSPRFSYGYWRFCGSLTKMKMLGNNQQLTCIPSRERYHDGYIHLVSVLVTHLIRYWFDSSLDLRLCLQ